MTDPTAPSDRADRLAERLAVPVLVAALASIPATFLTLLDEPLSTAGSALNTLSGLVLVAETVVLLAVAGDKRAWLRDNKWLVGLTAVVVPAVVFAVGPVQLLRLLRVFGALRILRVRRIVKAGRIISDRHGLRKGWSRAVTALLTLVVAVFVGLVLADPTSRESQWMSRLTDAVGIPGIVVAGLLLGAATFVLRNGRRSSDDDADARVADRGEDGGDDARAADPGEAVRDH